MDPGLQLFDLPPHRIVQGGEMGLVTDFVDRQIVRHLKSHALGLSRGRLSRKCRKKRKKVS
jgi:hypothetical protein